MNGTVKVVLSFAAGLVAGGLAGYFVTRKALQDEYAELANEEIESVKKHYQLVRKAGPYSDPERLVAERNESEEAQRVAQEHGYISDAPNELPIEPAPVKKMETIFERAERDPSTFRNYNKPDTLIEDAEEVIDEPEPDNASYDEFLELKKKRSRDVPYVISIDEWAEEPTHDKITLYYYDEDDTLTDERDRVIPDTDQIVGPDALTMFGKFSDDKHIVYVRSERNEADFEVVRQGDSYERKILGVREDADLIKMSMEDD